MVHIWRILLDDIFVALVNFLFQQSVPKRAVLTWSYQHVLASEQGFPHSRLLHLTNAGFPATGFTSHDPCTEGAGDDLMTVAYTDDSYLRVLKGLLNVLHKTPNPGVVLEGVEFCRLIQDLPTQNTVYINLTASRDENPVNAIQVWISLCSRPIKASSTRLFPTLVIKVDDVPARCFQSAPIDPRSIGGLVQE